MVPAITAPEQIAWEKSPVVPPKEYEIEAEEMLAGGSEEIAPQGPEDNLAELREKRRSGSTVESEDSEEADTPVEIPQYRSNRPVRKATKRQ
jgi:hypothetical protein